MKKLTGYYVSVFIFQFEDDIIGNAFINFVKKKFGINCILSPQKKVYCMHNEFKINNEQIDRLRYVAEGFIEGWNIAQNKLSEIVE